MKHATRGGIENAEADFVCAGREYHARKQPNFDAALFSHSNASRSTEATPGPREATLPHRSCQVVKTSPLLTERFVMLFEELGAAFWWHRLNLTAQFAIRILHLAS